MIHQMFSFPIRRRSRRCWPSRLIANELRSPMQVAPQALQQQIAATLAQLQPAEAIIG